MEHFDAIVLGAGGVGSAAAYHLARRGVRTLALDRFPGGHDRGSSHGETRVIRQAYFEHPDYVPLLLRAYERWAELESLVGRKLFAQVGLLQAGPPQGEVISGVLASAKQHGLPIERLSADDAMRRFPGLVVPRECACAFEPRAGYLHVEDCVRAHQQVALAAGADIRAGHAVQTWRATSAGVEVTTDQATFAADRLIITAGAWAGDLLRELNLPLRVLRKHVYWFRAVNDKVHQDRGCPVYLYELPAGIFYGFPDCPPGGVKIAEHTGGEVVADPLTDSRELDAADLARVNTFREQCLPDVTGELLRRSVCFYTMSADGHFYVDRHPQHPQVVFAAGLSGHGFKFTGVLGEALADLACDGASTLPVEFLRITRRVAI